VELDQRRIPTDSRWSRAGQGRPRRRTSGGAAGGAATTVMPAGRSLAARAASPGSADGILVNPAGRPEGPGGQSCTVAAMRSRRLRYSRPGESAAAEGHGIRECRPFIQPAWEHAGIEAIPLKKNCDNKGVRSPQSIQPGNSGARDDRRMSVAGAVMARQFGLRRSHATDDDDRDENCTRRPDARRAFRVLTRRAANGSGKPHEGVR
jgi:hypothetical protein